MQKVRLTNAIRLPYLHCIFALLVPKHAFAGKKLQYVFNRLGGIVMTWFTVTVPILSVTFLCHAHAVSCVWSITLNFMLG